MIMSNQAVHTLITNNIVDPLPLKQPLDLGIVPTRSALRVLMQEVPSCLNLQLVKAAHEVQLTTRLPHHLSDMGWVRPSVVSNHV